MSVKVDGEPGFKLCSAEHVRASPLLAQSQSVSLQIQKEKRKSGMVTMLLYKCFWLIKSNPKSNNEKLNTKDRTVFFQQFMFVIWTKIKSNRQNRLKTRFKGGHGVSVEVMSR